jgi:hypothetical protein
VLMSRQNVPPVFSPNQWEASRAACIVSVAGSGCRATLENVTVAGSGYRAILEALLQAQAIELYLEQSTDSTNKCPTAASSFDAVNQMEVAVVTTRQAPSATQQGSWGTELPAIVS